MGQQQLLLIILGVIIVGIAIAVGITMFSSASVQSNKDAIVNDLNNLAANAYQFKIRPCTMGGGSGVYTGSGCTPANPYKIPTKLAANDNATYTVVGSPTDSTVKFEGVSKSYPTGKVDATVDANGRLINFTYVGEFL